MLNFAQRVNEPLIIGDSVIFIRQKIHPHSNKVYDDIFDVSVDAPREIKVYRDDLVHRELSARGFMRVGHNIWRRNGVNFSVRQAVEAIRADT